MAERSSGVAIFEVAWRSKQSTASSGDIPQPLSMTRMSVRPASVTATDTLSAPASSAFSINSFTTDAGRWTTSPAAIILATFCGSILSSIYSSE